MILIHRARSLFLDRVQSTVILVYIVYSSAQYNWCRGCQAVQLQMFQDQFCPATSTFLQQLYSLWGLRYLKSIHSA